MVRIKIGLGHVLVNRNPNRVPRRPVLVVEKDAIGCLSRICRSASRGSVRGYQHASGGPCRSGAHGPRNEVARDMRDLNPAPSGHVLKGLVPDHNPHGRTFRAACLPGQIHAKIPGDRVGRAGI